MIGALTTTLNNCLGAVATSVKMFDVTTVTTLSDPVVSNSLLWCSDLRTDSGKNTFSGHDLTYQISISEEMLTPGVRIVRGPDWSWDNQGNLKK